MCWSLAVSRWPLVLLRSDVVKIGDTRFVSLISKLNFIHWSPSGQTDGIKQTSLPSLAVSATAPHCSALYCMCSNVSICTIYLFTLSSSDALSFLLTSLFSFICKD